MKPETGHKLKEHGIQPSAQRLAVADYVLWTDTHPSADLVWEEAKKNLPMISRATVYNTLNLFVNAGLLKELILSEGKVVFDPMVEPHHHFIDEGSGAIHDIPWKALEVKNLSTLKGFDIREYQVVLRGRREKHSRRG